MTTAPPHGSTDSLLYGEDSVEYSDDQSLYTMHGGNLYVGQDNMEYDDSTELSPGVYGDIKEQNDGLEEEYISNFTFLSSKDSVPRLSSSSVAPLLDNCTPQVYFYLTIILGSLLLLSLVFSSILFTVLWFRYIKEPDCKKVSRAESWRYESSVYVNPGRQKPSIPVYVPSPTIPVSSFAAMAAAQQIAAVGTGQQIAGAGQLGNRNSRSFGSPEVIPEESSNYNTLERLSTEGSTRAATPQQSPFMNRRDSSNQNGWSRTSTLTGQMYRTGNTPGGSPLATPQTSPLLPRAARNNNGHNRNSSLSSALRGVDIIRCTTPGYPPAAPATPGNSRRRHSPASSPSLNSRRRRLASDRSERGINGDDSESNLMQQLQQQPLQQHQQLPNQPLESDALIMTQK